MRAFLETHEIKFKAVWFFVCLAALTSILTSSFESWPGTYRTFHVPANTWPEGDSRNIQMAHECRSLSTTDEFSHCIKAGKTVRTIYPDANIPAFNYPKIWIYIYDIVAGQPGETGYLRFWWFNTIATIATLAAISWRFAPILFPLLIFSPITLLLIERGNIEGLVFATLFLPLLSGNPKISGAAIGIAGGLKIFPAIVAAPLLACYRKKAMHAMLLGFLVAMPIVFWALMDINRIIEGTSTGFKHAYGVLTLKHDDFFRSRTLQMYSVIGLYTGIIAWIVFRALRSPIFTLEIEKLAFKVGKTGVTIAVASLAVFCCTHLLLSNWDYRLIFVAPAACIAIHMRGRFGIASALLLASLFLIPFTPNGWKWTNFYTHVLALFAWPLLCSLIREQRNSHIGSKAEDLTT